MAARKKKSKPLQMLLGLCVLGGISFYACGGCMGLIDGYIEKQAEYAKSPEGIAEAKKKEARGKISDAKLAIWLDVEKRVKATLKNPKSANFGWQSYMENVSDPKDGKYYVEGWVDAQNSFGATVRSEFAGFYEVGKAGGVVRVPGKWAIEQR